MNASLSAPMAAQSPTGQIWEWWPIAAIKRLCAACLSWRIERLAIAHLHALSDAQLEDIGLARSQIAIAVRVGTDLERPRAVGPF
jgi:uncharacterized protein YjiS (DUF1127 family)